MRLEQPGGYFYYVEVINMKLDGTRENCWMGIMEEKYKKQLIPTGEKTEE